MQTEGFIPLDQQSTSATVSNWTMSDSYVISDVDVMPPSPLPKLMISPRHEATVPPPPPIPPASNRSPFHGRAAQAQYSPTHSIASTVTLIGGGGIGDVSPQLSDFYYNSEQSQTLGQQQTGAVPISPHVNVPSANSIEYRAVPPPLPPRRKERTESCADMAQKRQAPDAPTVSWKSVRLNLTS